MLRDTKSVLSCFHPATTARSAFNWAVVSSRRVFLSESSWQWQLANDVVTMIFSCAKKQFPDMPIKCVFFSACPWSYVYLPLYHYDCGHFYSENHGWWWPRWFFSKVIHGDSGLHRVASIGLLLHQEALQIRLLLLQRGHHLTSGSTVFNIFQLPVASCSYV